MKVKFVIPATEPRSMMVENCKRTLRLANPEIQEEDIHVACCPGFAASVNEGTRWAIAQGADIVVLVNSDILFTRPVLEVIADCFDFDQHLGILGGKLHFPNGTIQHAGGWAAAGSFGHFGYQADERETPWINESTHVQFVTGALFAFRPAVWEQLDGFDERFFLEYEDSTFCLRAWEKGWRVLYEPDFTAVHAEGGSRGPQSDTEVLQRAYWKIRRDEGHGVFQEIRNKLPWNEINTRVWEANGKPPEVTVCLTGALGDVIALTAAIHIYKRNNPTHRIYVRTDYPYVFKDNPEVEDAGKDVLPFGSRIVDCSMERQLKNDRSVGETFLEAFGAEWVGQSCKPRMHSGPADFQSFLAKVGVSSLQKRYAIVHAGVTHWRNRNYPELMYRAVCHGLIKEGFSVYIVGSNHDILPLHPGLADFRGKTNIWELREVINGAAVYIGPDSGPAWVAMTTETPMVLLFSSTKPDNTLPPGYPWPSIVSRAECAGCMHRQAPPVHWLECPDNKGYRCLDAFNTAEIVITAKGIAR